MAENLQERGSGTASAFGGSGNNTNASAGYLNGNNSVANSNTNYAASFALDAIRTSGYEPTGDSYIVPDNVVNKTEKIATAGDIQKAPVSVSRSASEMSADKGNIRSGEKVAPEIDTLDIPYCESISAENGKQYNLNKGLKTFSKHKRLRNIKAFLLNKDLIRAAIYEARIDKKVTRQLTWVMHHVDETVDMIYNSLKDETYVPKPYRFRTIHNKDEKARHLAILGFYDRCVQQVLKQAIQLKLRALEPRNVYSNLLGRGTLSSDARYCLYSQLKHDFRSYGTGYGLKMDIHHCYESISSEVIKRELFKYITDSFTRRLVCRMFSNISYLPIGDPLSGLYVNLVLRAWHRHVLDNRHHLFTKCYFFCDDSLYINKDSKAALHELCQEAREWFPKYANLHIKKNYKVFKLSEGVVFCGAKIFPNKILIRRLIKQRMFQARHNPESLASYKGILEKTNSAHLTELLDVKGALAKLKKPKN